MTQVQIIWDLDDDPSGNVRHLLDGHDVTLEEVEEVLQDPNNEVTVSRSSGESVTFGWTSTGKYLFVVWELVFDDPLTVYPLTAYPVPPPMRKDHGRRRNR